MVSQVIKGADQPRAQWYWKSNFDPWSTNGNEEWTKYSDIESAIIEEAFNQKNKTKLAELNNYSINLNDSIQISKSDSNKQRQIKRVLISRNESQGLREERFFLTPESNKTFTTDLGKEAYKFLLQWKKDKELSDAEIIEQAANGIIIEGKKLGQHYVECNLYLDDVYRDDVDLWHSSLAVSSLSQLLVTSSWSDEHCYDESETSAGAMEHLGVDVECILRDLDDGVDGL
ncbi:unnamed protein product [Didymodactylos carnosus]|uniref:WWE domain-containing protein n=1 Tax=Didymodactylos carnosus TaxID=1234261 RepID=A0A8S2PGG2_9BILA|nr:unnamed protein product [Didymodactylos carnosus]CAF4049127.1 unnamed protein product [Didymodactylos carnosus]